MGSTAAYSGQETGNTLIYDKEMTDPTVWQPLKVDKAKRIRYPSVVGNTFKNVTEQVITAAGVLGSAQFMTGRVVFRAGSNGTTVTLPTPLSIVQLLQKYYAQIHKEEGPYTASNGNSNRIRNEIEVEFLNESGGYVSLNLGTITAGTGLPNPIVIPNGSMASLKFIITATFPPAITAYLTGGNMSMSTIAQNVPLMQYANANQIVNAGTTAIVALAANQANLANPKAASYAAGVFTVVDATKTYALNFKGQLTTAAAGSFFSLRAGTLVTSDEIQRSNNTDPQLFATFSYNFYAPTFGSNFLVTFTNSTAGPITIYGAALTDYRTTLDVAMLN